MAKITDENKLTSIDKMNHEAVGIAIRDEKERLFVIQDKDLGLYTLPTGKDVSDKYNAFVNIHEVLLNDHGIEVIQSREVCLRKYVYGRSENDVLITGHIFEADEYTVDIDQQYPVSRFVPIEILRRIKNRSDILSSYLGVLS